MRQLTALDALFLAAENDRTQGHVSALAVYDPVTAAGRPLDAALVRELVTERLHLLPPLRWRLARVPFGLDHPYWVDQGAIDVDYHVREIRLPAPGDERQLAEQVADVIASLLDRSRPLWEMYVIHGLHDGAVAVLTKMHHAAVDGVSGAEVMRVLLDDAATGREMGPVPAIPAERFPSDVEMLGRGVVGMARHPVRALRAMPTTLPHLDEVPPIRHLPGVKMIARTSRLISRLAAAAGDGTVAQGNDLAAPSTPFQTRVSAQRRVAFGSLPLDDVKMIKNTFGCTVNDIVLAVSAAALRCWLEERGELPAKPLLSIIPVSVRTREQMGTFGNQVSAMIVELPTNTADAGERLRRVSQTMSDAKKQHRSLPVSLMRDATGVIPPALFTSAARAMSQATRLPGVNQPVNLMISNVPGPSAPLYLAGARQRAQFPISGVKDGIGLNITVFSYQDSLGFGIVVDREQVRDPWPILSALRVALRELRDLATVHASDVPRKRRVARNSHGPLVG
ncbi:MAG: wax ester/triacylglycerol synthase family O-acyltransferase [Mycobacterium sp.]|uniref:WS/DGAT/MGAT family O-acyltransferase n=1 Tax=Mycobacterium sp. TaxID=1785 RepID=UPI003BB14BB3